MTLHQNITKSSARSASQPIRVLLVDDSKVVRSIFARVLGDNSQIEIVGEAGDCSEALAQLARTEADIILLDIEMPKRSGLEALPDILDAANGARILVVSSFVEENGPAAIQALSLGACDTLSKPGRMGFSGRFPELLVEKVVRLGTSSRLPQQHDATNDEPRQAANDQQFALRRPACIAIGASTGGIPIIYEIVKNLPQALDCPIFIAQHLPEAFMEFLARQLGAQTDRAVVVPEHGAEIMPRTIYIAPGSAHLTCRREGKQMVIHHLDHFPGSRYSPSVDALFASVADCYADQALGIILSGMGNDGAYGAARLAEEDAQIVVQDPESSVVWGMPGAVANAGLADAILPPAHLTRLLAKAAMA
jgi:two-component system, chemotaxis family, protein-glutamate methylesterase/glutaminase